MQPVQSAGILTINQQREITDLSDVSGHYKPSNRLEMVYHELFERRNAIKGEDEIMNPGGEEWFDTVLSEDDRLPDQSSIEFEPFRKMIEDAMYRR